MYSFVFYKRLGPAGAYFALGRVAEDRLSSVHTYETPPSLARESFLVPTYILKSEDFFSFQGTRMNSGASDGVVYFKNYQ